MNHPNPALKELDSCLNDFLLINIKFIRRMFKVPKFSNFLVEARRIADAQYEKDMEILIERYGSILKDVILEASRKGRKNATIDRDGDNYICSEFLMARIITHDDFIGLTYSVNRDEINGKTVDHIDIYW